MRHAGRRSLLGLTLVSTFLLGATAAGPPGMASVPSRPSACGDLVEVRVGGTLTCTHGGDGVGHVHSRDHAVVDAPGMNVPAAPCVGNGRGRRRIMVFYGHPSDTPNRAHEHKASIRAAVSLADLNLDEATPGAAGQHYRLWCEDGDKLTVKRLTLRPIGSDGKFTFTDVVGSLADAGHDDPRRVYTVFVDNIAGAYSPGGQGTMFLDDDPDPAANANHTGGPHYSMVRLGLGAGFTATAFQHEVGHNLGAVQFSAPHTSQAGHCYDERDIMCYEDGGAYFASGELQTLCPTLPATGIEAWDCGSDDYYAIDPPPGSYLDEHWNLVDSGWLSWSA